MKISEQWLREWVDPAVDTDQLAEQLTMAGMEVEDVYQFNIEFTDVVVAKVESIDPHPDADRLKICKVNDGSKKMPTIVCGADNVKTGMHVPLARINANLPGDKTITATKLKGVMSEGMLCSAMELGLADEAEGILELPVESKPGQLLSELLYVKDAVIDLSLTPNRGDCLSIAGIAREVAVLNKCDLNSTTVEPVKVDCDDKRKIKLDAPEACAHYVGRVIKDVDAFRPTPLWIIEKLSRCGLRSINITVDITNYVMLELGQPMHAFDNDKLNGAITIRYAKAKAKLVLLDDQECELSDKTLVIADDNQTLAMAGVMGGLDSAVTKTSRNIFLESAYFNPQTILGQARRYGLHSDSSHRFERGVDYELQGRAIERASQLIIEICGGIAGPVVEESAEQYLPSNKIITLRATQIKRVLGIDIAPDEITRILQDLGMHVLTENDNWQVTAPSYRFDIAIEADLIEEIARIYGYNNIPDQALVTTLRFQPEHDEQDQLRKMCEYLVHRGYQEAITYSFVDAKLQALLDPESQALRLNNPIAAEMSVMRTSLWPGLLQVLIYNLNRQQQRVRLFETGLVFCNKKDITQVPTFCGMIYGNIYDKQWDIKDTSSDIFDIKGDVE
ncbi:MAG: phenylalanine--tRNA ligase subunit beta, partial [Gammaproteobacteria bacterium]